MLVFNVVVALFGAYMIWSALQMKKSGKINSMVLAQEELKKVKDTKGFIEFLYWREMLFGALVLIVGFLGVLRPYCRRRRNGVLHRGLDVHRLRRSDRHLLFVYNGRLHVRCH